MLSSCDRDDTGEQEYFLQSDSMKFLVQEVMKALKLEEEKNNLLINVVSHNARQENVIF